MQRQSWSPAQYQIMHASSSKSTCHSINDVQTEKKIDVPDVFLPAWVDATSDSSPSKEHILKKSVNTESCTSEEPSSSALHSLPLIGDNPLDCMHKHERGTVLASTSPGKIGRRKLKFSDVIRPENLGL